jgi:hypothetical protein
VSINNASYNGQIAVGYVDIAAGTTATVVITGGSTTGDENTDEFYIYTVDKSTLIAGSPTYAGNAISSGAPTTSNTVTANTSAGAFIITALVLPGFSGATGISITSSTETYGTVDGVSTGSQSISSAYSKKSGAAANTPTSVTYGWTTSAGSVAMIYTWR